MNKEFLFFILIIIITLVSCGNTSHTKQREITNEQEMKTNDRQSDSILDKINKVPITHLPIGVNGLDSITMIDYADFGIYNVPIDYQVDINNTYQLNDFFTESVDPNNYDENLFETGIRVAPVDSVKVYLSKRLPPKKNRNYFLCKIVQIKNSRSEPFIGWILLIVSDASVTDYILVAQSGEWEDTINKYALFHMDENYDIIINAYVSNSTYKRKTQANLYAKQYYYYDKYDNYIYLQKEEQIDDYIPEKSPEEMEVDYD